MKLSGPKESIRPYNGTRGKLHVQVCTWTQWWYTLPLLLHPQQQETIVKALVKLPYTQATPMTIIDAYLVDGQFYFHVLCADNIVQIVPYRVLKTVSPHLYRAYFRKRHATI